MNEGRIPEPSWQHTMEPCELVPTLTLTDFLLARIAEDESSARAATQGPWTSQGGGYVMPPTPWTRGSWERSAVVRPGGYSLSQSNADAAHIVRHDPARVMAECEAKREIVEIHSGRDGVCTYRDEYDPNGCGTLRALALPYAEHPDYCEEWRP